MTDEVITTDYEVEHTELDSGKKRSMLELVIPPDANPGLVHNNASGCVTYEFDGIFGEECTQEEVFDVIARDKIVRLMGGENSTIFAYGQTGSGKTYSVFGGDNFSSRGVIPRTLGLIFSRLGDITTTKVHLKISFTEVYGEAVYDLLDPQKMHLAMEQWVPVQILESPET